MSDEIEKALADRETARVLELGELRKMVVSLGGDPEDIPDDFVVRRSKRKFVDARDSVWRKGESAPIAVKRDGESDIDYAKKCARMRPMIYMIFREDEEIRAYAIEKDGDAVTALVLFTIRGREVDEDTMSSEAFREAILEDLIPNEEEEPDGPLDLEGVDLGEMDSDDLYAMLDQAFGEVDEENDKLRKLRAARSSARAVHQFDFDRPIDETELALAGVLDNYAAVAKSLRLALAREREEEQPEPPDESPAAAAPLAASAASNGAAPTEVAQNG